MIKPVTPASGVVMNGQQKYLEEYEKYKHIEVVPGEYYLKSNPAISLVVVSICEDLTRAVVKTVKSGNERERTLHWCRKNLVPIV